MAGKFKKGARCSSTCPTRDHRTFGECMRSKGLNITPNLMHTGRQKKMDVELQAYRDAKRQGVQPASCTQDAVDHAMKISDQTGTAFKAG